MNTALSTLKPHAEACRSRRPGLRFQGALLLVLLLTAVSAASAAITFDSASTSKAKHNTSEISWKHTVGGGSGAAVVVAVSFNDLLFNNNQITSVKLGGVTMRPVPDSLARTSGLSVKTITQLFYLNGAEAPAPGTYDVSVTFTGKVDEAAGGAVSLFGVEPGTPAAVATNANLLGLGQISTSINAPAYSWVVDVVGSGSGADFTAGAGQTERFGRVKKEIGLAGSAQAATFGGPTTLLWQQADTAPLATSAVAFAAKPVFKLSTTTTGAGSIQTSTGGDMFHEGEPVTLTASPAPGWEFAGWGGDVTGTANPASLTMDGDKSVTANFIQVPPSISAQPASQTVNAGSNVSFNVAAGGTAPLSYQWYKDGAAVAGATGSTLSLSNVQAGDAGGYAVTVTNGAGSLTSNPATLTVITPPTITTQPASQTVNAGQTATFNVAAGGTSPFAFQWKKDGADIPGANSATFSVANAQEANAGSYSVVVSNAAGSATSDGAALTVITPPTITTQPAAQSAPLGSSVSFTVAAGGTSPFNYQWKKDGADIAGANSDTLSLTNVQDADAATYTVVVSNAAGSATSTGAALAVITPPSISLQPEPQTVNAGATANFFVSANGTAPLGYQWKKDGSDIPGATSSSLAVANAQDVDAGTYTVVVSNAASSATSDGAALTVTHIVPPTITTQPASQTKNVGEGVTFTVVAGGTAPSYQWQKNGSDIAGATAASLTLSNVQLSDAADYSVEVSNDAGIATSDPATLTVVVPPSEFLRERFADGTRTNQNLPASADWFTSSGSSNFTATVGQATQVVSSSRTLLNYFTNSTAAPVNVGVGQTLTLDFVAQFTGFDTGASVGSNTFTVALLRSVANPSATSGTGFTPAGSPNTNARVSGDFGSNSSSAFNNYGGYAAMTYTGTAGAATPVKLYARTGANTSLLNSTSPFTQFTTGGTAVASTGMLVNNDYRGTLTIENTGSGVRVTYTLKDAATGTPVMNYSATQAAASFTQFDTAAFYLSKASSSANYNLVIKSADVSLGGTVDAGEAPSITTQPVSQTVSAGANVSFSVAADGTAPLSYQWQKNGAAISGATSSTLNLSNVQGTDSGSYRVVVSNAAGSATSTTAVLNVLTGPVAPAITSQPASQTVVTGGSALFNVIATGTAPLSYQWYKDGSLISGATSSSFSLSNVQATDAGGYSVVVSNAAGTANSNTAALTVTDQLPGQIYNLQGFAQAATGAGIVPETDPNYRKVYNANDLVAALGSKTTKVIEIMNDLDLGYNEVPASARTGALRTAAAPLTHPVLLQTGVSTIDIQDKTGLTIFSANGATIRHAEFNVKRANNLIIRNLKFDELWEWDESSKGNYDKQDWDFITVDMTSDNVWIDHCTFTKAYDGVVDVKGGSKNVTISWSSFVADDGGPNSFVRKQIDALEANRSAYPMYNFLRTNGFSTEDIIAVARSQKKGHLVGANEFDTANANHRLTLHHNYYLNMQDRMPRLRGGDAHVFNVYVNNTEALAAKDLRNARVAAMTPTNASKLTGSSPTYHFDVTLNGSISTEGGAVLLEKSQLVDVLSPLRNNQVSASQPEYTGKILALDTLYSLRGVTFRGDSTTPGSPLAPVPAPEIAFSWNGFTTLPYAYATHDPSQLPSLLTGAEGAGAGMLSWPKENWLKTSY
ncbi:MAG TPA: immunoglobulin domain-containing protein [Pyrinomonadaceae bacterium]|nr:immunoglobulin domain-containing protein [Pyrinomonadaceae bacterium]